MTKTNPSRSKRVSKKTTKKDQDEKTQQHDDQAEWTDDQEVCKAMTIYKKKSESKKDSRSEVELPPTLPRGLLGNFYIQTPDPNKDYQGKILVGTKHQATIPDFISDSLKPIKSIRFKPLPVHPLYTASLGCRDKKSFNVLVTRNVVPHEAIGLKSLFLLQEFPKNVSRPPLLVNRNTDWGCDKILLERFVNDKLAKEAAVSGLTLVKSKHKNADALLYDKWFSSPLSMTEEEYSELYNSHFPAKRKPLHVVNVREVATEEFKYKALLFVSDDFSEESTTGSNFKYYIKSLPCQMVVHNMLPEYLCFIKGIVDVDAIPNTASEQRDSLEDLIQQLTLAAIEKFLQIAKDDSDEDEFNSKDSTSKAEDDSEEHGLDSKDSTGNDKKGQYLRFWSIFGMSIKLGIIEDAMNRSRLAKLLRFESSKSDGKMISLDFYISRMKDGQHAIFYLIGIKKELLETSTFLKIVTENDYEVLLFVESFDENLCRRYVAKTLSYKFCNASAEKVLE